MVDVNVAVFEAVLSWNDRVQDLLFDPQRLTPACAKADVSEPPRFNACHSIVDVKPVDGKDWKLEVSGRISDRTLWTADRLAAFQALPGFSELGATALASHASMPMGIVGPFH